MEAMVALFVLAVASTGLLLATRAHIDSVGGLEDRVAAQWIAENRLAELNLGDPAAAQGEVAHMVVPQRMAARLRLHHQGKGGIGVDVDGLDRVHLDRDAKAAGHGRFLIRVREGPLE